MSASPRKLNHPPIVEAVIDIDCVLPRDQDIAALESPARAAFRDQYPKLRTVHLEEHVFEKQGDAEPEHSARREIHAYQLMHEDERQIVQVRKDGFSFNRLAPYMTLDDYLPEIRRTWQLFVGLASPVEIRAVKLRFINRILLPIVDGRIDLDRFFEKGPRLPDEEQLTFLGFLNQHVAVERDTGNQVTIILATENLEDGLFPIILDIEASRAASPDPGDWDSLLTIIQSLRDLKDRVFFNTLAEPCIGLFQ